MIKEVTLDFKTEGRMKGMVGVFLDQVVLENISTFLKEENILPIIKIQEEKFIIPRKYCSGQAKYFLDGNQNNQFSIIVNVRTLGIDFIFSKSIGGVLKQDILKLKVPNMYKFEFDVEEFLKSFRESYMSDL